MHVWLTKPAFGSAEAASEMQQRTEGAMQDMMPPGLGLRFVFMARAAGLQA
jgi:hypothetical protein